VLPRESESGALESAGLITGVEELQTKGSTARLNSGTVWPLSVIELVEQL
jgi:hypothetical protein